MTATITFYHPAEAHGFLSNFARYPVIVFGRTWPTGEHAYQGCKPVLAAVQAEILRAPTPAKAAAIGRNCKLRSDWEDVVRGSRLTLPGEVRVKDAIMYEVVKAKFQQNDTIRTGLFATGSALLVEASSRDSYWGWGCNKQGLNKLGQILMLVRAELSP
jgi:ribA/ribD-fused uncharacterized protein